MDAQSQYKGNMARGSSRVETLPDVGYQSGIAASAQERDV